MNDSYDIAIIGAGIIGTAIARELSRYQLNTVLIEKENDVANGTTKANSAIVHAGYDAAPGSLKARFNVAGNQMYEALCQDLQVPFQRVGSLVVAYDETEMKTLEGLYQRGTANGVPRLTMIDGKTLLAWEPHLSPRAVGALHAPTAGIVGPWELAIALAENAVENGVHVWLQRPVTDIKKLEKGYLLTTPEGTLNARMVINAAGVEADRVCAMVAASPFTITPSRGEYQLFDKAAGHYVKRVIFQCPTPQGKNVVVLPTVHGNLLVGPTAAFVNDRNGVETTREGLAELEERTRDRFVKLPWHQVITSFSGLRAKTPANDFIIGELSQAPGFFNVAAIDSPGLTAAPAIGEYVATLVTKSWGRVPVREGFQPKRRSGVHFDQLSAEEKADLVKQAPSYGRVICRCETITEGEIVDAIHRPVGAVSLDGVKRRVRAGGGRCQGGFCGPRVMEIIAREKKIPLTAVVKDGPASWILSGQTKSRKEEGR
ncbi:NAD(P)/FAD-dependent oxidoreductase [Anoxynatronum sibiricum]|uniref:NAD(P)/FAD-dependent oxidoreductase n=1 Tax=Anoxynatronum sibiricum TaxID=210623 RepID=A0ABU9VZP2_9CLOT